MGQLQSLINNPRVEFDESGDNGLLFRDKYIPEELVGEILFRADHKTLLNCQLVCKRWQAILRDYVWRKKSEFIVGKPLHLDDDTPWKHYYVICSNKFAQKNLLRNHSGRNGSSRHWDVLSEGGDAWEVECPPIGVPRLPISEPVFEGQQHCFVTSYYSCSKEQTVDLIAQGLSSQIMDKLQPVITIGEWYAARIDCPASYECSAKLTDADGNVLESWAFRDSLQDEKQNVWLHVEHEFAEYGPGVRKVTFYHGGIDRNFWNGHYGSKMAGACVKVDLHRRKATLKEEPVDRSLE